MFAVHIISTPEGLSFVGKGTASEDKLRANIVPDAFEVWVGPPVETREQLFAAYLGVRAAFWQIENRHPVNGWYSVPHRRAIVIAQQSHPVPWACTRPTQGTPLSKLLTVLSCDQETLAAIIGASTPKVSRLMAGVGELSLSEWHRVQAWAQAIGVPEVLADTFSPLPEPQAPAAKGLKLVGGTEA